MLRLYTEFIWNSFHTDGNICFIWSQSINVTETPRQACAVKENWNMASVVLIDNQYGGQTTLQKQNSKAI